jgi:hypothetical protein
VENKRHGGVEETGRRRGDGAEKKNRVGEGEIVKNKRETLAERTLFTVLSTIDYMNIVDLKFI